MSGNVLQVFWRWRWMQMEHKLLNGNQAAALAVKLARVQIVCAYPITPQTSLVENIAEMWSRGQFPGEYVSVESEYSALSYLIGAGYAGARTFTATSCQGLAYMHELLHWSAGARLPMVMVNVNRTMGAPWSLETDQLDSLSQRDTGWMQFYCADVQEIIDTVLFAFCLVEEAKIPCMVSYDGFILSHTYEAVKLPTQEQVDAFLPLPPGEPLVAPSRPETIQPVCDWKVMSRAVQSRHREMSALFPFIREMGKRFQQIFERPFSPLEAVDLHEAETVIVAAGAVSQTVKSVLPFLNQNGSRKGLLRLFLFRPLPQQEIAGMLSAAGIKKVVVIDRNLSSGTGGIFAQELRALLQKSSFGGRVYELNLAGGVDLTKEMLARGLAKIENGADAGEEEIIWGVDL